MSACRLECMTCDETGSVGGYCYSISQHINSTIEGCRVKTNVKNQCFHCFVWLASWGRETKTRKRRHRGERQDTLILSGLVLTSLWEALFSLPWKESMWLILQAVASPCSLTSLSLATAKYAIKSAYVALQNGKTEETCHCLGCYLL